jgi:formate--tetrahydrofolate ligase
MPKLAPTFSMPVLDPTVMEDWQIAEAAEKNMKPVSQLTEELGILPDEVIPMGRQLAKIDYNMVLNRLVDRPTAKYIDVTAITPTPLGEGKTTTSIGLIDGLSLLGKKVTGALRQPSSGPTFNIKGSAAGGGLSQCIPLAPFSIRFTGDIDSISNAHNLCMVALTRPRQSAHQVGYGLLCAVTAEYNHRERRQDGWSRDRKRICHYRLQ